jgi:CubicO group peptidase (beta-lactamase class C family)
MKAVTDSSLLEALGPSIAEILQVSGAAGASVGVFDGRTHQTHLAGFGFRDLVAGLAPDEHTIYHIASLSKSFTASAIALLVADGKLSFEDRMDDVLPSFHHADEAVNSHSTLLDFLSHRTGLASKDALWQQDGHELLLGESDTLPMVTYLEAIQPLGKRWTYNNFCYDVLANVISHVSGSARGEFATSRIIQPLGLGETTTALCPPEENWGRGYMPGPDEELTDVGRPVIAAGTVQQGANGIKSTVSDLLIYYKAVLDAWRSETGSAASQSKESSSNPLKNVKKLLTPRIPLDPDAKGQWYGAGWAIAELPAPLGSIGTNGMFVPAMPLVGRGCKKEGSDEKAKGPTVWYHNGSLVGFFSSVHILPETGIIIVVLVNSRPKNDAADWVGQLLVEEMLGCPEKNDYLALAKESAAAYDAMWAQLPHDMEKARSPGTHTQPLSAYAGRYYNKVGNWFIEVVHDKEGLQFSFQGRATQCHRLQTFGTDVFCWPLTEAESRARGRWPDLDIPSYVFHFGADEHGNITTLRWQHDPDVPEGETFVKAKADERVHAELSLGWAWERSEGPTRLTGYYSKFKHNMRMNTAFPEPRHAGEDAKVLRSRLNQATTLAP